MKKKNTGLIVLVIVLSLLVVGLGGFIIYDKVLSNNNSIEKTNKEEQNDNNSENQSIDKLDNTKDIVYSGISYNISGHNDEMNGLSEIPQINLNSDNINQINNDIINHFKSIMNINEFKSDYKYGFDSSCDKTIYKVEYEYYNNNNNDILSLIIKYTLLSEIYEESSYMIYNINTKTGELITNNELIKVMNYKTDDIKESLKNSINEIYTENFDMKSGLLKSHDIVYNSLVKYIDENNIYLPIYINKDGILSTYARIPANSHSGFMTITLTIG